MVAQAMEQLDANSTPCDAFWALYKTRIEEAQWWGRAALAVGIATAAALVAFIAMIVLGEGVGVGLTALAALVNGGASIWLWSRRTAVQESAANLLAKVRDFCSDDQKRELGV